MTGTAKALGNGSDGISFALCEAGDVAIAGRCRFSGSSIWTREFGVYQHDPSMRWGYFCDAGGTSGMVTATVTCVDTTQ